MADAYLRFLRFIFIENAHDKKLLKGLRETRNKFLSCYYYENSDIASCFPERIVKAYKGTSTKRYLCADYYSLDALKVLRDCLPPQGRLRYEHVVPKGVGIQDECEAAVANTEEPLTAEHIAGLLDERWHMAVVSEEEEKLLHPRKKMPSEWTDILVRYRNNGSLRFPLLRVVEDAELTLPLFSVSLSRSH